MPLQIKYKKVNYKYKLEEPYLIQTGILNYDVFIPTLIMLEPGGMLLIKPGYAWDGPSGPTLDTKNFMRASLCHDALYQLMRTKLLPETCREQADKLMYRHLEEDGMGWFRRQYVFHALRNFAAYAAKPRGSELLTAP